MKVFLIIRAISVNNFSMKENGYMVTVANNTQKHITCFLYTKLKTEKVEIMPMEKSISFYFRTIPELLESYDL